MNPAKATKKSTTVKTSNKTPGNTASAQGTRVASNITASKFSFSKPFLWGKSMEFLRVGVRICITSRVVLHLLSNIIIVY